MSRVSHRRVPDDARHLGRGVKRQCAPAVVIVGEIGPVLERHRGFPAEPEAGLDPHRRAVHRGIDVAAGELPLRDHVGAGIVMEQVRALRDRPFGIVHIGQGVVIDDDLLGRVFGQIAVPGDHSHHGFADIAHLVLGQGRQVGGVIVLHPRCRAQRRERAFDVRGRDHRHDTGHRLGLGTFDPGDAGMGVVAAPERDGEGARELVIVDIGALAGEQARVLDPEHAGADEFGPQAVGDVVSHRRPRPSSTRPIEPRRGRTGPSRRRPRSCGSRPWNCGRGRRSRCSSAHSPCPGSGAR